MIRSWVPLLVAQRYSRPMKRSHKNKESTIRLLLFVSPIRGQCFFSLTTSKCDSKTSQTSDSCKMLVRSSLSNATRPPIFSFPTSQVPVNQIPLPSTWNEHHNRYLSSFVAPIFQIEQPSIVETVSLGIKN